MEIIHFEQLSVPSPDPGHKPLVTAPQPTLSLPDKDNIKPPPRHPLTSEASRADLQSLSQHQ